jgi:protein-S-isoprenylcysteine O-methyltransferase Ste14
MFVFLTNYFADLWSSPTPLAFTWFSEFYDWFYQNLFLVDTLFCVVGYILTLRLLDSHIRSSEPTAFGWVICLMCYQPFYDQIGPRYLNYESDNFYWGDLFGPYPVIYVVWGSVILLLLAVYASATMSFGLRFSNLTNRGIITQGPYALMKHPAYVTKNISWWMISIPFLSRESWPDTLRQTVLLGLVSTIYLCRAITEERHLAREPAYREYQAWIREHGLWARMKRLAGFGRFGEVAVDAPAKLGQAR